MSEPRQFDHLPMMTPPEGDGTEWTLDQDWSSPPLNGKVITIKAGYKTDGASIPQACWSIIGSPMEVPLLGPALCHDALYSGELVPDPSTADWMLLQYAQMAGIGWAKRNLVWSAVRLFGWTVWNRHTSDSVAASRKLVALIDAPKGEVP